MTAQELSAEEREVVQRFEAAPVLAEAYDAEVERVARALWEADGGDVRWEAIAHDSWLRTKYVRLARAALAARRPATEAEKAVERVRALADELDREGVVQLFHGPHNANQFVTARIRAALGGER